MEHFIVWYNLIFYIPLAIGLLFALGAGLDFGHDIHTDAHADVHADADHDASADNDADHDAEHDNEGPRIGSRVLGFLGFGRVPVAISLMALFLIFGGAGLIANTILGFLINVWGGFAVLSVAAAVICAFFGTAFVSRLVSRVMPTTETTSVTKHDLLGCSGKIILEDSTSSPPQGIAQITNANGDMYQIRYISDKPLPYGTKIFTIDYDQQTDRFTVEPDPTAG